MEIELLVVTDCPNDPVAAELISRALVDTGVKATVIRTVISNEEQARQRGFLGSPTILLDGVDPFGRSDAQVGVACRLYSTPHGLQGIPSLRDLRQALKRSVAGQGG
jgi:hypothetical protein